jgi:hypothetical protein
MLAFNPLSREMKSLRGRFHLLSHEKDHFKPRSIYNEWSMHGWENYCKEKEQLKRMDKICEDFDQLRVEDEWCPDSWGEYYCDPWRFPRLDDPRLDSFVSEMCPEKPSQYWEPFQDRFKRQEENGWESSNSQINAQWFNVTDILRSPHSGHLRITRVPVPYWWKES